MTEGTSLLFYSMPASESSVGRGKYSVRKVSSAGVAVVAKMFAAAMSCLLNYDHINSFAGVLVASAAKDLTMILTPNLNPSLKTAPWSALFLLHPGHR